MSGSPNGQLGMRHTYVFDSKINNGAESRWVVEVSVYQKPDDVVQGRASVPQNGKGSKITSEDLVAAYMALSQSHHRMSAFKQADDLPSQPTVRESLSTAGQSDSLSKSQVKLSVTEYMDPKEQQRYLGTNPTDPGAPNPAGEGKAPPVKQQADAAARRSRSTNVQADSNSMNPTVDGFLTLGIPEATAEGQQQVEGNEPVDAASVKPGPKDAAPADVVLADPGAEANAAPVNQKKVDMSVRNVESGISGILTTSFGFNDKNAIKFINSPKLNQYIESLQQKGLSKLEAMQQLEDELIQISERPEFVTGDKRFGRLARNSGKVDRLWSLLEKPGSLEVQKYLVDHYKFKVSNAEEFVANPDVPWHNDLFTLKDKLTQLPSTLKVAYRNWNSKVVERLITGLKELQPNPDNEEFTMEPGLNARLAARQQPAGANSNAEQVEGQPAARMVAADLSIDDDDDESAEELYAEQQDAQDSVNETPGQQPVDHVPEPDDELDLPATDTADIQQRVEQDDEGAGLGMFPDQVEGGGRSSTTWRE